MAGSPPNLHNMDSRSACMQGVFKVKVKGHVIRALSWIFGMSYSVIDGLVCIVICFSCAWASSLLLNILNWIKLISKMHHQLLMFQETLVPTLNLLRLTVLVFSTYKLFFGLSSWHMTKHICAKFFELSKMYNLRGLSLSVLLIEVAVNTLAAINKLLCARPG